MGNGRKQRAVWTCLVQGILLSLGIYLALLLLVTLLVVKGALGEDAAFPALAVSCGAAALAGGLLCARRSSWGTMPSALASALGFAAVLGVTALLCWAGGIAMSGLILLVCAGAGGVAAGFFGGKRGRRVKRKGKRR